MNRATRGPGLHLVPSQQTERIQAIDPPSRFDVWEGETVVERVSVWYANVPARYLLALAAVGVCCIAAGFLIAVCA